MSKVVVYTANFGDKDITRSPLNKKEEGVDYICFTDNPKMIQEGWNIERIYTFKSGARRTARWLKANPHILFRDKYDYSIWIDSRLKLKKPVQEYIDLLDEDTHVATTIHPARDCIYDEAKACKEKKLDDKEVIDHQMKCIEDMGYPKHNGLAETSIMIRRHNDITKKLNFYWSGFLINNSIRDQLSFDYIMWKLEQKYKLIPRDWLDRGRHNHGK